MFQHRSPVTRYTRQQTERWLAWLAWQLAQHGQTGSLEHLQPDWLPVRRRWLPTHARLLAVLVGLLGGLDYGLLGWAGRRADLRAGRRVGRRAGPQTEDRARRRIIGGRNYHENRAQ